MSTERYSKADIEKWRAAYSEKTRPSFLKTQSFKRRVLIGIGLFIIAMVSYPFVPETTQDTNIFAFFMSFSMLGVIIVIEQLITIGYYFRKEHGPELFK